MKRLLLFACLLLCACATPLAAQRYTGDLVWSFETSSFTTDDGRGPWWLSGQGEAWSAVTAPIERSGHGPWGRVHLVIEGNLSAPGHFGQLGRYQRQLQVTRVISSTLIAAQPQGS
jgi:hypothetical protein